MAFRFPLQPVLRLRKSVEHREELRLEMILHEINAVRREIETLAEEAASSARRYSDAMSGGLHGAELHFQIACDAARRARREQLENTMLELEKLRRAQQIAMQRARQDREAVESLRRRSLQFYIVAQSRREQQQLDEMFLMRRNRREGELSH